MIHAATTFVAVRYDLLQSLHAWTTGDFSGVLRGRYELLWIGLGLTSPPTWRRTVTPWPAWAGNSPPTWA